MTGGTVTTEKSAWFSLGRLRRGLQASAWMATIWGLTWHWSSVNRCQVRATAPGCAPNWGRSVDWDWGCVCVCSLSLDADWTCVCFYHKHIHKVQETETHRQIHTHMHTGCRDTQQEMTKRTPANQIHGGTIQFNSHVYRHTLWESRSTCNLFQLLTLKLPKLVLINTEHLACL